MPLRFAEKQFFKLRKIVFFRACLDCFQCGVIVKEQTTGKQQNDILTDPVICPKSPPPRYELPTFKPEVHHATLTITRQEPCQEGILLSHSLSLLWLQRAGFSMGCSCGKTIFRALIFFFRTALMTLRDAQLPKKTTFQALKDCFFPRYSLKLKEARLCKKTTFQALKHVFFHTALMKLREARLCKKNNFSDSIFFCTLTLWNSDKPGVARKTTFQALKNCFFFLRCSHETQTSPALQKTIFQALKNHFFACLVSNLPTPPRYLV